MHGQPHRLYSTSFNFLNDGDSSGNEFYKTSFLVKKRKENCGQLFTSPIKHETFQAVVGQQRPRTKNRDARANLVVVLLISFPLSSVMILLFHCVIAIKFDY